MKTIIFTAITVMFGCTAGLADDDKKKKSEGAKKEPVTLELHVTGMSCHNCADAVEDALAALKGVEVESVDPKGNLAIVKYVPGKVTQEQMAAAVKATKEYSVEKTVGYSELEYENDGSFSLDGKSFTGTATDKDKKTGKITKSYQFKDGKLHGLVREWYADGTMAAKKFYRDGLRHGSTQYWDEKGELTAKKLYKDDVEQVDDSKAEKKEAG